MLKYVFSGLVATMVSVSMLSNSYADALTDKVKAGETIRIGFANEVPWAYPGENNEPLGFVHVVVLGDLLHRPFSPERLRQLHPQASHNFVRSSAS